MEVVVGFVEVDVFVVDGLEVVEVDVRVVVEETVVERPMVVEGGGTPVHSMQTDGVIILFHPNIILISLIIACL